MDQDKQRKIIGVSPTVFTLGIVSLLTDISSEMLVPIVPQFLKFVLGASTLYIGVIEGIAECVASVLRVYAGYLADKFGRPKLLTVIGYGLSALSKPFYIIAMSWPDVLGIRFADRFGKGIRSAPRDVLIADTTPEAERGKAFGLHRAMDTTGAVLGPLIVVLLVTFIYTQKFLVTPDAGHRAVYNTIFIASAIPAVLGWLVLSIFVRERRHADGAATAPVVRFRDLDSRFRVFLAIVTLFSIGNSSDAFLVLRATSPKAAGGVGMGLVTFLWVYSCVQRAFGGGVGAQRHRLGPGRPQTGHTGRMVDILGRLLCDGAGHESGRCVGLVYHLRDLLRPDRRHAAGVRGGPFTGPPARDRHWRILYIRGRGPASGEHTGGLHVERSKSERAILSRGGDLAFSDGAARGVGQAVNG